MKFNHKQTKPELPQLAVSKFFRNGELLLVD